MNGIVPTEGRRRGEGGGGRLASASGDRREGGGGVTVYDCMLKASSLECNNNKKKEDVVCLGVSRTIGRALYAHCGYSRSPICGRQLLRAPNHHRWYAKCKLSRNAYTLCSCFCTFGTDLCARSVLINKISASELRRKFIKSALLVGRIVFF